MKRILSALVIVLFFCGTMSAQSLHWSHPSGMESSTSIIGFAYLDGVELTSTDYEVGAFVGEECRGSALLKNFSQLPDVYWVWFNIYYNTSGETVNFKLYQHSTETEYDICTTTIVLGSEVIGSLTDPCILNFYTPFDKEITGFGCDEGHYYLIASPVISFTPSADNGFLTNDYDLYYFDQSQELEWVNHRAGAFDLVAGKGYLYANNQDVTLEFSGVPYSGDGVVELDYDANATYAGWNLIGNPFGVEAYLSDGRSFYRMNDGGTGIEPATTNAISPIEGIFVVAEAAGESVTFTTEASSKTCERIVLNLSRNRGVVDRAVVRLDEGGMLPKFQLNANSTKLYIPQDNKEYAVVNSAAEGEMPINFKANENGNYILNVNVEGTEMAYLHLIDNMTGADVDLLQTPNYSFDAKTNDYASRFKLVFSAGQVDEEHFAFFTNGSWVIANEGEATLQVIDVNGHILSNETINGNANVNVNSTPGVYMIRLIKGNDVKVQKVVEK